MKLADTQTSTLPTAADSMSTPTLRTSPRRNPSSPKRSTKDSRSKRTSPPKSSVLLGIDGLPGRSMSKVTRSVLTTPKPLVPVTERRSQDDRDNLRIRRDGSSDNERWEVAPDGGSGGREGRQFTVANVGNNGRIYLRPTVRPAHQRYPQPNFTFPVTPPGTAGLDALTKKPTLLDVDSDLHQSQWSPSPRHSPLESRLELEDSPPPPQINRHRRALSDSTVQDGRAENESDAGAFRIVISKPQEEQRPKTTEDLDANGMPHLNINIPTWRIGVPRFTATGTPLIRGSSYAPSFAQSDEWRSMRGSAHAHSPRDLDHTLPSLGPRRPSTLRIPQARFSRSMQRRSPGMSSPKSPNPLRATYMSSRTVIDAPMYDDLTFKPACDDRQIVRYASHTSAVTAATPPRLVAEITSPSFLDYELISDFFLTFRSFLEPQKLLRMLVARLRWSCARNDETGMIVHVRTFVALRHWILNYFMDDFVVDYDLRDEFCNLLNSLVDDLAQDSVDRKVQLKILNELKKCWRRVRAHYWDGPDSEDTIDPRDPILPGGIAGHRDPNLDPTFWNKEESAPPRIGTLFSVPETAAANFYTDASDTGHDGDSALVAKRPATPDNATAARINGGNEFGPWSPTSPESLDILSCSFPSKNIRNLHATGRHPLAAHPVISSSVYNKIDPVATAPKALVGKRVRPNAQHQQNGSDPDSPAEYTPGKVNFKDHELTMALPHAGSLVRGDVLPPGQAFVEIGPRNRTRHTTVFSGTSSDLFKEDGPADAMSGRGMKKLIGTVRRALSTRGQAMFPAQGHLIHSLTSGQNPSATSNRVPGTAVVPQKPSSQDGVRPPVRIDLLGSEVLEAFKRAVREDAAAEAEQYGQPVQPPSTNISSPHPGNLDYSAAHLESSILDGLPRAITLRPTSEAALTGGSKSIVIVDDTLPVPQSDAMARPSTAHSSVEAFADTLMLNHVQITPPITPPANHTELARRSSHLLNENIRSALSPEPVHAFVPDLNTLGNPSELDAQSEASQTLPRQGTQRSLRRAPSGNAFSNTHTRHGSTKTHQSLNSILHHTEASFSSDMIPPSTMQSLDATTYTRYSVADDKASNPVPKPLRGLRRRPGGDLRAANHVEELGTRSMRRSQSMDSFSVFTESVRSSVMYNHRANSAEELVSASSVGPSQRVQGFSVGQLTSRPVKKELSLCSTRSSKPVMRPSFEAEAKKLAQIPDDEDDGGVESALLKLEGKFEKRASSKLSTDLGDREIVNSPDAMESETTSVAGTVGAYNRNAMTHFVSLASTGDEASDDGYCSQDDDKHTRPATHLEVPRASTAGNESFLSDASRESYTSIPLLERGLTDDGRDYREAKTWADRSILQEDDDGSPGPETALRDDQRESFSFIQKMDARDHLGTSSADPLSVEEQSFLDSDLSSELSAEDTQTEITAHPPQSCSRRSGLPTHALAHVDAAPSLFYPSPPLDSHDPKAEARLEPDYPMRAPDNEELTLKPLPPTPDATPGLVIGPRSPFDLIGSARAPFGANGQETDASKNYSVHLPFVLAFDSETLAQQFTIIEKDALNEIDWKELVDMDWRNARKHESRSWVDFLRNSDAHGVEVVIARFNLVVKWVASEIVLTQHIEERARTIIKFIHVAAQCRLYRNFATLAQLTIALSSNEVSRLARTWELVPPKDIDLFRDLESLVTPMRNFLNLRAEMESGPDAGCIPFVGIYTHDLLYNGQRPSEIASSPDTPPLVNFERCRIAAGVVKTLLRLLEASTRYKFKPIEGVTERCLWIGALSDDEIRRHSGNLE